MRLPIPDVSSAVLIGCSRFEGMPSLPSVIHNISDLRGLLMDEAVWGLPHDRCVVMAEPSHPRDIIDTINRAAERATDTFLLYYAGHGLLDDRGRLHLGLGQTHDQQPHTALSYEHVRAAVQQYSRAELNIVILDCCYSGTAIKGVLMGADGVGTVSAVEGAYVLTSSAATESSMAPPEEHYTAFSGELIRLLRHGCPDAGPQLGFDDVFRYVSRELAAKDLPQPQQAVRNLISGYAFAPNQARAASSVPPARKPPPGPAAPEREAAPPGSTYGRPPGRRMSPPARRRMLAGGLTLSLAVGTVVTLGLLNSDNGEAAPDDPAAVALPGTSASASAPASLPASASASASASAAASVPALPGTGSGTVPGGGKQPPPVRRQQDATVQGGGASPQQTTKKPADPTVTAQAVTEVGRPALVNPPDEIVYLAPDTVNYSWQAVSGAAEYVLETEATDGVNWQPVATHRVSGTSFSESWASWQKFRWRVVAVASDGRRGEPSDWRRAYNNTTA